MPNNTIVWQPRKLFDSTSQPSVFFLYGKQCFLFGKHFLTIKHLSLFGKLLICLADTF